MQGREEETAPKCAPGDSVPPSVPTHCARASPSVSLHAQLGPLHSVGAHERPAAWSEWRPEVQSWPRAGDAPTPARTRPTWPRRVSGARPALSDQARGAGGWGWRAPRDLCHRLGPAGGPPLQRVLGFSDRSWAEAALRVTSRTTASSRALRPVPEVTCGGRAHAGGAGPTLEGGPAGACRPLGGTRASLQDGTLLSQRRESESS